MIRKLIKAAEQARAEAFKAVRRAGEEGLSHSERRERQAQADAAEQRYSEAAKRMREAAK